MRLFVFGPGYVGLALAQRLGAAGWSAAASARGADGVAPLAAQGIAPVLLGDAAGLAEAVGAADAVLVTAPPDEAGCPGLAALAPALEAGARPGWIGYLSTTGVYGDRGGRWVFEDSPLRAQSVAGARRVAAETGWLRLSARLGLTTAIFRLPGIYGPGRSAFDRLREGKARRIIRPGQVFSRIHREDLTAAVDAAIARPRPGAIFNLCDDLPCPPEDVIACAAALMGVEPPPEERFEAAEIGAASQRFFAESKRVSNARAKAELGWRPAFATYREGLAAIWAGERDLPRGSSRPERKPGLRSGS